MASMKQIVATVIFNHKMLEKNLNDKEYTCLLERE